MSALKDLFMTDYGLMSIIVIVFTIGMAVYFSRFFAQKIAEDEARQRGK